MENSKIQKKPTRTISGVAPLAVMLPPRKCDHGACTYCPTLNAPQSYTPLSPAVIRAREHKYSAKNQIKARLENFKKMNHPTDKIELIIMGGTFLSYDRDFQFKFIKDCYDALNEFESEIQQEPLPSPKISGGREKHETKSSRKRETSKTLEEAKKKKRNCQKSLCRTLYRNASRCLHPRTYKRFIRIWSNPSRNRSPSSRRQNLQKS